MDAVETLVLDFTEVRGSCFRLDQLQWLLLLLSSSSSSSSHLHNVVQLNSFLQVSLPVPS